MTDDDYDGQFTSYVAVQLLSRCIEGVSVCLCISVYICVSVCLCVWPRQINETLASSCGVIVVGRCGTLNQIFLGYTTVGFRCLVGSWIGSLEEGRKKKKNTDGQTDGQGNG